MRSESSPTATDVIEEVAAAWVRRRHFELWGARAQAEFDAWINSSLAHEVAYLRLDAAWSRTERLAALRPPKKTADDGFLIHWKTALSAAAGIVFVAALSAGGLSYMQARGTLYTTPVGGHRTLLLSDGSRIEMNTNSVLRLESSGRSAFLERGEAYFDIKHDAAHPFTVRTDKHRVVDVGTIFTVRSDAGKTRVTLIEGEARLEPIGSEQAQRPALLTPGDVAIATADAVSITREPTKILTKEVSWRRGVLVFENATLSDAAGELNRYNTQKLVIADAAVGRTRIDASIPINGVEVLARIARDAMGLRVTQRGNEIILQENGGRTVGN